MRPYLCNGTWINLDTVNAIGPLGTLESGEYGMYSATITAQLSTFNVLFGFPVSWKDWPSVHRKLTLEDSRSVCREAAEREYAELVKAWHG